MTVSPGGHHEQHLRYIDGLRALAVLGVVIEHAWLNAGSTGSWWLDRLCRFGTHGVDLFFVISGFCLAYPYLGALQNGSYTFAPARFYSKRFLRIIPPYYAAIAVILIFDALAHVPTNGAATPSALLGQLLFLDQDQRFLTGLFWTLPIEFRWYFAFPLLLWLFARAPRAFAALGLACVVLFYWTRIDAPDTIALSAFMLGIWAAWIHHAKPEWGRWAAPLLVATCLVAYFVEPSVSTLEPVGIVAMFALVVQSGRSRLLKTVLDATPLVWIGIASYSIYLVHGPVMLWLIRDLHVAPPVGAAGAIAFAFAFWFAFERPITRTSLRTKALDALAGPASRVVAFLQLPSAQVVFAPARAASLEIEPPKALTLR